MSVEIAARSLPAERHIALFLSSLPSGAIQRVGLNLAQVLAGRGHRVDLIAARSDGEICEALPRSARVLILDAWSTRLPWLRSRRRRWLPASAPELARYLRRERPEVLLAGGSYANLAALAARRLAGVDVRVVLSEHNPPSETCNSPRHRKMVLPSLMRRFYPHGDGIVAVSNGVADDLADFVHIPRARIAAIPNPVLTPALLERAAEPLAHPWFERGAPPVVIAVGRLSVQKDFSTLVRAFARLRGARPARLLILGEGDRRSELETLVAKLGLADDVALPGFVANPLPYMARSAVFALTSIYEGLGNVLVEALACGCSIVSTDSPGGPVEVLESGKYGRLVPPRDEAALASALAGALDAPFDPAAQRARARAFSAEKIADRYLEVLFPGAA